MASSEQLQRFVHRAPRASAKERHPAARALLGYAELCTAAAALVRAASAGPAGLGLKEQPLKRISAFNRVTAARHLENPSLELLRGLHRSDVASLLGLFITETRNAESLNRGHKNILILLKTLAHHFWYYRRQERPGMLVPVRKKMWTASETWEDQTRAPSQ